MFKDQKKNNCNFINFSLALWQVALGITGAATFMTFQNTKKRARGSVRVNAHVLLQTINLLFPIPSKTLFTYFSKISKDKSLEALDALQQLF